MFDISALSSWFTADNVNKVGMGLQAGGALASMFGSYNKSSGEQQGYTFQAGIARTNAGLATQQAHDVIARGAMTENQIRHKGAQIKGAQVANMAARNIDLRGSGSATDLLVGTEVGTARDVLIAQDNTNREAWGDMVQANNYTNNANFLDWRASQQSPAGDAFASVLGSLGKVATSWYSMRNATAGTGGAAGAGDIPSTGGFA